jgi:hypothetical protein
MNTSGEDCDGSSGLGQASDERLFYLFTTKIIYVVKNILKSASSPAGYAAGVGYGLIWHPIAVVPHLEQ